MALVNHSVLNVVNSVANFFSEMTDIPTCTDPIINNRMRELMVQHPRINTIIISLISEIIENMKRVQNYDHYDLEKLNSFLDFQELITTMTSGWFNYDKYIGQYSEHEIGDMIYLKIQEIIVMEAERLFNTMDKMDDLADMMFRM